MIARFLKRFARGKNRAVLCPLPRLVICEGAIDAIVSSLEPEVRAHEEGIAFLLGLTTGTKTLVSSAVRPHAATTSGSFMVDKQAMAPVVRAAANHHLQIVGQIHTHPGDAYHSDGDVEGARIAYAGFTSLVLPDYGQYLPKLTGLAAYLFQNEKGFVLLESPDVVIAPAQIQVE